MAVREGSLAARYCGVSLTGLATDLTVLHLLLRTGLEPAWARVISLLCAMHVTFALNRLHVFRQVGPAGLLGQWARYMACNGVGNLANYWIFVAMVSTHWPLIARPAFAVAVGSICAWVVNFATTRFLVFRGCCPGPAASPPRSDP